jgi:hypothetical protein
MNVHEKVELSYSCEHCLSVYQKRDLEYLKKHEKVCGGLKVGSKVVLRNEGCLEELSVVKSKGDLKNQRMLTEFPSEERKWINRCDLTYMVLRGNGNEMDL